MVILKFHWYLGFTWGNLFTRCHRETQPASFYLPALPLCLQEVWGGAPQAASLSSFQVALLQEEGTAAFYLSQCTSPSTSLGKQWSRGLPLAEFARRSLGYSPGPSGFPQMGSLALTHWTAIPGTECWGQSPSSGLTWLHPFPLPGPLF